MSQDKEREIVELLRSVMYSSNDGNNNFLPEVERLGELLGEYDGVPYDAAHNRLTQALISLGKYANDYVRVEDLNGHET